MESRRSIQARLVRRDEDDGSFNREFWQAQGAEARFAAAWEMVEEAQRLRGEDAGQSRLQRSVQRIKRRGR